MSYLHAVRLAFAGSFQADVSTVNNDVRHYDNQAFEPVFQDVQTATTMNGWWNPAGTGAFRLIDCRVTGVWYADGTSTDDPAVDPIVGTWIGGSSARTSGKLVDIDPQWQLASEPWGLEVRITDQQRDFVAGRFRPAAFRDLWFTRLEGVQNDPAASSTFQSVLDDVSWRNVDVDSRFLGELRGATLAGQLSIRLATYGFQADITDPRFTLGTVLGAIGPQLEGEPTSYIAGRRLVPASAVESSSGITFCSAAEGADGDTLFVDLSNAIPLAPGPDGDAPVHPADIGTLSVGILRDPTVEEDAPVSDAFYEWLADIPYRDPGWLAATSGIVAAPMTVAQQALAADHPLALAALVPFNPGAADPPGDRGLVAIRESGSGLVVCAEPTDHRIDAGGSSTAVLTVRQWGRPLPNTTIALRQMGRIPGQGGGSDNDANPPKAPIPDIGVPPEGLVVPASATTGPDGSATITLSTPAAGPGNPRGYLDGQIYLVDYRFTDHASPARQQFEFLVVHARDAYPVPAQPTWDDVKPILTQYSNLYPIMSHGLFDLADEGAVLAHRDLLLLAFGADPHDPNHMPVTRDLSDPKRDTILRWLTAAVPAGVTPAAAEARAARPPSPSAPPGGPPADPRPAADDLGGKTQFALGFRRAVRHPHR